MINKKIIFTSILILFIIFSTVNSSLATVKVTKENLNEALQKFVKSDSNEENYSMKLNDNDIEISDGENTYKLDYDLTDDPIFSITVPINSEMNYEEFKEQTDKLLLPMFGYIATLNVEEVEINDALLYFLSVVFSNMSSEESKYMVVKDEQEVAQGNVKVIKESEFSEHLMEYVNEIYGKETVFEDDEEKQFNTMIWTTEKQDISNTSCNLVSTIEVNMNIDFSKLKGFANFESNTQEDLYKKVEEDKEQGNQIKNNNIIIENVTKMPRTGKEENPILIWLYAVVVLSIIGVFYIIISYRKDK